MPSDEGTQAVSHIFGPVASRRLGLSLGVDVVPPKTCTFDCIYCQAGHTTHKTTRRREFFSTRSILRGLDVILRSTRGLDYITFSGSGEPTLARNIGDVIKGIRRRTTIPIAVITNGSLLYHPQVRRDIESVNMVMASLDAATEQTFERLNRPAAAITLRNVIKGLTEFCGQFKGKVWLEVMLVRGINDSAEEVKRLKEVIGNIKPDEIDLNTVVRPPQLRSAKPVTRKRLQEIARELSEVAPTRIIGMAARKKAPASAGDVRSQLIGMLRRRSCTLGDIVNALGIEKKSAQLELHRLAVAGDIEMYTFEGRTYFTVTGDEST